jgi:mannose-6-phosphate isomerase-like protein (cupin superfamily)
MKTEIKKQDLTNEFFTAEKCYIIELSNSENDPDLSIARARVEHGVATRRHQLKGIIERYFILSGKGVVEIGTLPPQEVTAGDIVLIPPMCVQRITNIGKDDLIFLAICTPRFTWNAYEDVDEPAV